MRDPFTRSVPYWGDVPAITMYVPFFGTKIPIVVRPTTAQEELDIRAEAAAISAYQGVQDTQEGISRTARFLCQIRDDVIQFSDDPAEEIQRRLDWVKATPPEINDESLTAYTLARVRMRLEIPPVDDDGDVQRLPLPDQVTEAMLSQLEAPLLALSLAALPAWHRPAPEPILDASDPILAEDADAPASE